MTRGVYDCQLIIVIKRRFMLLSSSNFRTTKNQTKTRASALDFYQSRQALKSSHTYGRPINSTSKIANDQNKVKPFLSNQFSKRPIIVKTRFNPQLRSYRYRDTVRGLPYEPKVTELQSNIQKYSQKQKFIQRLQQKVLKTQNNYVQSYQLQENSLVSKRSSRQKKKEDQSESLIDICQQSNREHDGSFLGLARMKTDGNEPNKQKTVRAKSAIKDFSKLVEQNFHLAQKDNDQSLTVELNQISNHLKASLSLSEIEKMQQRRRSPGQTQPNYFQPDTHKAVTQRNQPEEAREKSHTQLSKDTQIYEEEMEQLTSDYFQEWEKMKINKSQLYESLRGKLVKRYPQMRKKYNEYEIPPPSEPRASKKRSQSDIWTPALQSSIRIQRRETEHNLLTVTQLGQKIKQGQAQTEQQKNKKTLKQIFKQAFIWSLSRKRHMNEHFDRREVEQSKQVRQIQKNMTYLGYMKKKGWKNSLKKNIRGTNLEKNKDSILSLQKEGSSSQLRLQKCLEDAIQTCIRYR